MANKKKRRRQRQRAAAKKEDVDTYKKWYNYTVAGWSKQRGGPVRVISVAEYDDEALLPFIFRIFDIETLDQLDVLDIHKHMEDGKVDVICELSDWPPGTGVAREKGQYMRGMHDKPIYLKGSTPAGTKPLAKEPAVKPKADKKAETVVVPPAVSFKRIPLKWYTVSELKVSS